MSASSILKLVTALTDLSIAAGPLLEAAKSMTVEDWAELDAEYNSEALKLYAAIARKREAEKG